MIKFIFGIGTVRRRINFTLEAHGVHLSKEELQDFTYDLLEKPTTNQKADLMLSLIPEGPPAYIAFTTESVFQFEKIAKKVLPSNLIKEFKDILSKELGLLVNKEKREIIIDSFRKKYAPQAGLAYRFDYFIFIRDFIAKTILNRKYLDEKNITKIQKKLESFTRKVGYKNYKINY